MANELTNSKKTLATLNRELRQQERAANTWDGLEPKAFDRDRIDFLRNEVSRLTTEIGAAANAIQRDAEYWAQREERARLAWAQ